MNQREAKQAVCGFVWTLVRASQTSDAEFWFMDEFGNERSDSDIAKIALAARELLSEMARRSSPLQPSREEK